MKQGTTLNTYPTVVLGTGDMEFQALALGKEFLLCHCNHCEQNQLSFGNGASEPLTLKKLADAAEVHRANVKVCILRQKKIIPKGYKGVKSDPLFSIPTHLW
eukprot:9164758-Ditylum_brightwellii.AAC.1